jgi:AbrB family looped-hinge helix DNA binding protein
MQNKVTINERGVITIPTTMRDALGIKANDELIIEDTERGLLLRPAFSVPIEIYSEDRISEFTGDEDAIGKRLPPDSTGS